MQLVEILDHILEQLPAPKQHQQQCAPYIPQVQQTLSACLSVSRKVRHLAAERLFQTLHVKSSTDPRHLDILLRILAPQPPAQEWMSIRPFIHTFLFSIDSPIQSSKSTNHFVQLFNTLSISNGNYGSQISHFELRVDHPDYIVPLFNHSFEDAVLRFVKSSSLRSLDIHGRFFTRDFLLGSQLLELGIWGHGIDLDLESTNDDLYTEELALVAETGDDKSAYPSLKTFETDLVWPRGFPERALEFILSDIKSLSVEINISHAFLKAEALIRKTFSTLTTLIITYNFDGYEAELPTAWSIDFGEMRALETLEFTWKNSISSIHQNNIARGCRPLAGLLTLLDTIRTPLHKLTTIRWNFWYLMESLPPVVLEEWLVGDARWRKLDERLVGHGDGMFGGLEVVEFGFCPVVMLGNEDDVLIVESVLDEKRGRVFPGLTAILGDKFLLKVEGETIFAGKGNASGLVRIHQGWA